MRLGQLFNVHEKAGRVRQDRFSPAFAGATMQKVTEDPERFNQVVADLWTAPHEAALDSLGRDFADRSQLPGAGSSLPSMLLYLRDPAQFGMCINATMGGLAMATGDPPFRADSRANYERFCQSLREWRERYAIAPQEADAVLAALWRNRREKGNKQSPYVEFGDSPLRFLADLAANNNGEWMRANRDRYRAELRKPFVALLEQIAVRYMRELDPQLDVAIKTNHVLASIRKRFPNERGEYYEYLWGAFSRGRKQEDVQFSVLVQPAALEASLFLGSATSEQIRRLRDAIATRGETLMTAAEAYRGRLTWEIEDREYPTGTPRRYMPVSDPTGLLSWLDSGGTAIKWTIPSGDPLLADSRLPDLIGELFRAMHPLAAAAWGDPIPDVLPPEEDDSDEDNRSSIEDVAEHCYLPPETVEDWVSALNGRMRQGMFYGPPGTGKTFVATELAHHLASSPDNIVLVQFHSSYSYEDFIEGLRPETVGDSGTIRYTVRPGLFQELCTRARAALDETFVLIIDEMNRADVAAVFGELLLLLEYRSERSVILPYSQRRFSIPENVIVLGTMNTADRSLPWSTSLCGDVSTHSRSTRAMTCSPVGPRHTQMSTANC